MAAGYVTGSRGDADGVSAVTSLGVVPGILTSGGSAQATTSGNVLLAFFTAFESGGSPVDITGATATGATFTEFETITMNTFSQWQTSGFVAENITGQATHTVTGSVSSSSFLDAGIVEIDGAATSGANNADTSATGTSTNPTGAAITPTANGLHVFYVVHNDPGAFTAVAGWDERLNTSPNGSIRTGIYTRAAVSGVSQTPSVTHATSAAWSIIHIVITDAGGGAVVNRISYGNLRQRYRPSPYQPGNAK